MPSYCWSSSDYFQSLHCPIDFSFAFFVHLLLSLFTSLYFLDLLGSNLFFLSSLLLSQVKNFRSDSGWQCLPGISLSVSVAAALKVMIIESMTVTSLFMMLRRANVSPIIAWKVSNTLGSFSFSRTNLSFVCFGLLIFFRWRWKVIISKSWSLPMSVSRKLPVPAMFTSDRKCFFARM